MMLPCCRLPAIQKSGCASLVYWDRFIAGSAPMLILTCFFGGVQLFFIGLFGEYIMSMNARIMNRPLVVEEKRLNFEKQEERDGKGTED